jgi:hypothetical protein
MVKLVEATELTGQLTSFHTELGTVDTTTSLQERYDRYKSLLERDSDSLTPAPAAEDLPPATEKP